MFEAKVNQYAEQKLHGMCKFLDLGLIFGSSIEANKHPKGKMASGKLDKLRDPIMKLPCRIFCNGMGESSFTNLSMSSFESSAREAFKSSSIRIGPRQILNPRSPFDIVTVLAPRYAKRHLV